MPLDFTCKLTDFYGLDPELLKIHISLLTITPAECLALCCTLIFHLMCHISPSLAEFANQDHHFQKGHFCLDTLQIKNNFFSINHK